ncbi:3-hydroxyacyl-ACP dehydratase FabZ, partial [Sedimenticola sp.]|uniref:3-hydroxyacyl-ACP dehydratase FabZ n=1 Tax=Sedimenticola sp. TaxID=1940285 RepID=UPI003D120CE2
EPFFPGHFPSKPVMPGVLILEALAQATALLVFQMQSEEERRRSLFLFAGIDNVRFRRQVEPGDQLILEANLLKLRRGIGRLQCKATVDGEVVTEADIMGAIQTA